MSGELATPLKNPAHADDVDGTEYHERGCRQCRRHRRGHDFWNGKPVESPAASNPTASPANAGSTLSTLTDNHLDAFFAHKLEATAARLNSPQFMQQLANAQFASDGGGKQKAHALVQQQTEAVWEDLKPELRVLYEDFDTDGNNVLDRGECVRLLQVYLPKAKTVQTAVAVGQVRNLLPTMIKACVDSIGNTQMSLRPKDVEGIVMEMFESEYIPIVKQAYDEMFDKLAEDVEEGVEH